METNSLTVPLSADVRAWLDAEVAQGGYRDATEYICSLITQAQRRQNASEAELEDLLEAGLSDPRQTANPQYWDDVRRQVWETDSPAANP